MDWIQVGLGILAGVVYSLMGWLRNRINFDRDVPDEKTLAEIIMDLREREDEAKEIAEILAVELATNVWEIKGRFNKREFLITVAQGLVIGLFMGGLGLPLDVSISLATQLGLLTLVRKIIGMIKV